MVSKNDPDYLFEEYKEYTIASHKDNVAEKSINNLIIVYQTKHFPERRFIVGFDDSKMSGRRQSFAHNIEDAKNYIDWVTEVRQEKKSNRQSEENPKKAAEKQQPIQPRLMKRKGRRM
ncbi:hypothetical protein [Chryseobacterium sp. ISL-6]|uniref:hypothetical protein n=1 Tax=Chryseobacterium sp. ISL-6 TaxID=2819143 RepID=UPI001BE52EF8|nr:hypothetical protein [Chryseobacterium sp. ISL-6]MBT2621884.1 hypothetical protein [Chryseobacterium sp. ISL-6]